MSDGASIVQTVRLVSYADGPGPEKERALAVEAPVNMVFGTVSYAVMMATPADLEDFALGFCLTEGVIEARADVRGIAVAHVPDGIRVDVDLVPARFHGLLQRRRAMAGRTSCGVCGIEDLASLPRARVSGAPPGRLDPAAVQRALQEMPARQHLGEATRATHAAAWARPDGTVACVREDVGRHNALDKLIGALLSAETDPADGFVVVTSRCSYEMVEKTAAFGARALVAVSAPTSMGVDRARHHGMTLVGIARSDSMTMFTGPDLG